MQAIPHTMPQALAESTAAVLQQHYALARRHVGDGRALVVLHLGAQQSAMAVGTGAEAALLLPLPLGLERTAAEHFKTTPPTPLALENAIMVVEDVVMPLRRYLRQGAPLLCADAAVRELAQVCGVPAMPAMRLSLEALERGFNRFCNVVQGTPAAHEGLPADNRFATALLIVREFMHHLQFADITVIENPPA
jgi:exopolyphosphatase/pppGpp-phosphohydrolase